MKMHTTNKMQPWLVRAALVMIAPSLGCDPDGDTEELAVEDETDDEGDDDEFRTTACLRPANPSSDVSGTLAGAATYVTREGSASGTGCDLFTVRVATPSGHRAREISIGGFYAGPVDAVAYAWKRTCTDGTPTIPPLCTTWQALSLDPLEAGGGCVDDVPQIGEHFCWGSVDGGGDIPANSYSDILVGARVEYDDSNNALPVEITVSE